MKLIIEDQSLFLPTHNFGTIGPIVKRNLWYQMTPNVPMHVHDYSVS